jgi:gamma-glutamyl hydrolase
LATRRILIPGGAANFSASGGFGDAGRQLYSRAILKNSQGVYFPVWGTCLGFELLTYLATDGRNILTPCEAENMALPLELKEGTSQDTHICLFQFRTVKTQKIY